MEKGYTGTRSSQRVRVVASPIMLEIGAEGSGQVLDLSEGGAFVITDRPLQPDGAYPVRLATEAGKVDATVRVVRCSLEPLDPPSFAAGIRFEGLTPRDRRRLRKVVAKRMPRDRVSALNPR
jgi:PilZ domain